jgi:hypothetical protein
MFTSAPAHRAPQPSLDASEQSLAALLGHRFGDGLVYMQDADDRALLALATARGWSPMTDI